MTRKPTNKPALTACFAIALVAALAAPALPVGAAVTSGNVAAFGASPSFINLNRTTQVTLEIQTSHGANDDNYRVSILSPSGSPVANAWYNFTAVGSLSLVLGNATGGFQALVTEVGFYELVAEWWNTGGSAFEPAASAALQTTDVLFVETEFAAGSDPYADLHNCQLAEEFQRGDGIIARGYMRLASTGEILNGTNVPSAKGNITGSLFATDRDPVTKVLNYNNAHYFWRAAWEMDWDQPLGVFQFTVTATDGLGNHGTGTSPPAGVYGALKVVPAKLPTDLWTENATSGKKVSAFYPGETVTVVAFPYYDQHFNHNYNFTNTDAVNKNESYRLGPDRGGAVAATIGTGAFNSTSREFATQLAAPTMAFDAATNTWRGTWVVPAGTDVGNITVKVFATDGASAPNAGSATAYFSALARPPAEVVTNTVTVYDNKTVEVAKAGMMDSTLGYGLLVAGLAAGVGAGLVLMRRGGGKSPSSAPAPAESKGQTPAKDKKKGDEGWD
jgi:hypothetical protein